VTLTIRKFNAKHFGIEDLIRIGTMTQELAEGLKTDVVNRQNILVSGATGTGKTTLLNTLANFIPSEERILVIEDTAEIQINSPNLVRFEARREQSGLAAITIRDLLKASLRHRPDRILLGEIRGAEAFDLLQLLNTGHSGTISTVHANSAHQALSRFTSCVLQSNVELPYRAVKTDIADSLNLLIHVERRPGRRFVAEVLRIAGYHPEHDRYAFEPIFTGEQLP
jgi:pilus assembly protein CpaF